MKLETDLMTYTVWINGNSVGLRCTDNGGRVSYIYLNPSTEDSQNGPNVFLYQGPHGSPLKDRALEWFATDWHTEPIEET